MRSIDVNLDVVTESFIFSKLKWLVNIKMNLDEANEPFIITSMGFIAFIGAIFLHLFFFLSLTDHTPPFLGAGPDQNLPEGIYLSLNASFGFALSNLVLAFIFITAILLAVLTWLMVDKLEIGPFWRSLFLGSGYIISLFLGVLYWPGIDIEGRRLLNQPNAVELGLVFQVFVVGIIGLVYSNPIFPNDFPNSNVSWDLYIQNQWRKTQILLAFVVTILFGTAIPLASNSGSFGISGTTALLGLLISGPAAIILFYLIRLQYMEKLIRKNSQNRND